MKIIPIRINITIKINNITKIQTKNIIKIIINITKITTNTKKNSIKIVNMLNKSIKIK